MVGKVVNGKYVEISDKELIEQLDFQDNYEASSRIQELKRENAKLKREITRLKKKIMDIDIKTDIY